MLLAVPQRWWKLRHLRHHGLVEPGRPPDAPRRRGDRRDRAGARRRSRSLAALAPALLGVVLPALAVGFGLCALQGHAEHARAAAGVDYHGRIYNRLWFNDGFHAAHHRAPGADWRRPRPATAARTTRVSRLPPALRWAEALPALANRAAPRRSTGSSASRRTSPLVRRHLLRAHAAAFAALLSPAERERIRTVTVIGGASVPAHGAGARPAAAARALHHRRSRGGARRVGASGRSPHAGLADRVTFEVGSFDAERPAGVRSAGAAARVPRRAGARSTGIPLPAWSRSTTGRWRTPAAVRGARVSLLPKRINLVAGPAA